MSNDSIQTTSHAGLFNETVSVMLPGPSAAIGTLVMLAITCILSIACNLLNLAVLPKLPEMNEASRVFYVALSLTDLITGFLLVPMVAAAVYGEWVLGGILCKLLGYLFTMVTGMSSTVVFFLNADRFIAVTRPLRYRSIVTRRRVLQLIGVYTFSSSVILFFFMFFGGDRFSIIIYRDFGICMVDFSDPHFVLYTIASFACSMWAYALLLLIFYVIVLHIVRRHAREIANQMPISPISLSNATDSQENTDVEPAAKRSRWRLHVGPLRSVLLAVSIAGTFYIAWLPFTICEVVAALRGYKLSGPAMTVVSRLTLCNSWLNTVIYMMLKKSYRNNVAQQFRGLRVRLFRTADTDTSPTSVSRDHTA